MLGKDKAVNWFRRYNLVLKIATFIVFILFVVISNIFYNLPDSEATATLLIDDDYPNYFSRDIANATTSISCAMYMYKLDYTSKDNLDEPIPLISSALHAATKRGVKVDFLLELGDNDEITTIYNKATAKHLQNLGVSVRFNSRDKRLHTKMCIIDGLITYIGSHNFTYSAMARNAEVSVRYVSKELAKESLKYIDQQE